MSNYTVVLTEQELTNLKVFLNRVNLTGFEVHEYMKILIKLNKSEVIEDGK